MFASYFLEGLIVGSLLGLLLRPVLDYYVTWRAAKELERPDDGSSVHVDLAEPPARDTEHRRVS